MKYIIDGLMVFSMLGFGIIVLCIGYAGGGWIGLCISSVLAAPFFSIGLTVISDMRDDLT